MRTSMTTSMPRGLGGALVALALGLLLPVSAAAADFVVNSSADPGDGACDMAECTLREAITTANENSQADLITFADGITTVALNSVLVIDGDVGNPLTIQGGLDGTGMPAVTIQQTGANEVFVTFEGADATLDGLVITGGNTETAGGGILNIENSTLTVTNSTISGNSADIGGGIFNASTGTVTVTNSTISGNIASFDGGGIGSSSGTITITNSTISGNSATSGIGGGISNFSGTITIASSTISGNNSAGEGGGGIFNRLGLRR
jgi:CSLREA domain-containing protein